MILFSHSPVPHAHGISEKRDSIDMKFKNAFYIGSNFVQEKTNPHLNGYCSLDSKFMMIFRSKEPLLFLRQTDFSTKSSCSEGDKTLNHVLSIVAHFQR